MKPGDLVKVTHGTSAKLFSSPLGSVPPGTRSYRGFVAGIGVVLDIHDSDVKVICGETIGWCYIGNLVELE
jgi:hypothetical protein